MSRGHFSNSMAVFATIVGIAISFYLSDRAASKVERVTLPGFTLELPAGQVTESSQEASGGSHKVDLKSTIFGSLTRRETSAPKLVVHWMSQGGNQEEWRASFLPVMVSTLKETASGASAVLKEETIDEHRWLFVIGEPKAPVAFGVLACDENFQVMVMYARYRDVARQAEAVRKILLSGECTTPPSERARLEAAIRLPTKFGRTSEQEFQAFKSLDGEMLLVNFTNGDVLRDRKVYKVLATALLSTSLETEVSDSQVRYLSDPDVGRPASLLRYDGPGENEQAYLGTQYCRNLGRTLMIFWVAPGADDDRALQRVSQVGCPGEQSNHYERFSELAAEACDAGNKAACDANDTID